MVSPAVQIRDYIPADKPYVFDLINDGFQVDTRFRSHLDDFLDLYLQTATLRSTHFRIALVDDKPAGLLIGRVKGERALSGVGKKLGAIAKDLARLVPVIPRELAGIRDWATEQVVGMKLVRSAGARNLSLDNEVVLFVVGSATRGTGVGKALFAEFAEFSEFSEQPGEFFLYTDSRCTWQFYEKRGMRRVAQARRISPLNSESVEHYIYAY